MPTKFKKALIIGADRETGRAVALQLAAAGTDVLAVARITGDLESLEQENANIAFQVGDGTRGMAANIITEMQPDLLVLASGVSPKSGSYTAKDWESFGDTYSSDMRTAIAFLKAAIDVPLAPGSTIVTFSSNEGVGGCAQRGGHSGTKRMQHNLADYAAWEAERRGLGLRCFTIYPKQSVARAKTADVASRIYARPSAARTERLVTGWDTSLTPNMMADRMAELVDIDAGFTPGGWSITGREMTPSP